MSSPFQLMSILPGLLSVVIAQWTVLGFWPVFVSNKKTNVRARPSEKNMKTESCFLTFYKQQNILLDSEFIPDFYSTGRLFISYILDTFLWKSHKKFLVITFCLKGKLWLFPCQMNADIALIVFSVQRCDMRDSNLHFWQKFGIYDFVFKQFFKSVQGTFTTNVNHCHPNWIKDDIFTNHKSIIKKIKRKPKMSMSKHIFWVF